MIIILGSAISLNLGGPALAATPKSPKAPAKVVKTSKPVAPAKPVIPPPKIHVVASGDSLSIIAGEEQLESWRPLWNANSGIQDPDLIYAGEQLVVPTSPVPDRPLPAGVVVQPVPVVVNATQTSYRAAANYADGTPGILARVRMRESGGNYADNTGNGYYGAYQFSLGTWRGVGGSGLPSDASPAEQDMRAQMLYNARGCSPWPNTCY